MPKVSCSLQKNADHASHAHTCSNSSNSKINNIDTEQQESLLSIQSQAMEYCDTYSKMMVWQLLFPHCIT